MSELSKVQLDALQKMAAYRDGVWLPTPHLMAEGIGIATLRSLDAVGLIDSEVVPRGGKWWTILPEGRRAAQAESAS